MQIRTIGEQMKSKNNIPAALLTNPAKPHAWVIKITLGKENWTEMRFNQKELALSEYNRIKGMGIFGGQWIDSITIDEQVN
jgi:hypothetical protein